MTKKKRINFIEIWSILISIVCIFTGCSSSTDLEWHTDDGYRWANVDVAYFGSTGFNELSSSTTNIDFTNQISAKQIAGNRHYLNGSGVTTGDIDGDGLADIYFARLDGSNVLYKNMGGMQFKDITQKAGVAHQNYFSTGAVFADVNGDNHLDLLVTAMHKDNAVYVNDGNGMFKQMKNSGLGAANGSMTMTLADVDGDGDLDLYIAKYKEKSIKDIYSSEELAWENILEGNPNAKKSSYPLMPPFDNHYQTFATSENRLAGVAEVGVQDAFYWNNGDGSFKKASDSSTVFLDENGQSTKLQQDWGLTAKFQDLNDDGLPDLYVCNDFFSPDRIWMNQGNGTFKAIAWSAIRNSSYSSMAVDFSDINKDGRLDMFVTEMLSPKHDRRMRQMGADDPTPNEFGKINSRPQYNRNSLFLQQQDRSYAEIAYVSGLEATEWSWATRFMDINLDGFEDLIINTGYTYDILDIDTQVQLARFGVNMDDNFGEFISQTPPLDLPNKMFINNGDLSFNDKSSDWGFDEPDVAHGLATADFDNDGDLDFVINRLNKKSAIFENTSTAPRIAIRLKSNTANTYAIGAKIQLKGGPQMQEKEITSGGDYLSGSTPVAVFAANDDQNHQITITWPDGTESKIDSVKANRIYEINQSGSEPIIPKNYLPDTSPIFVDVSERINHQHQEDNFEDFALQPLLPKKLSELGPGISWIDYDMDGDDDLFISTGKGGTVGAFKNSGTGSFTPIKLAPFKKVAQADQTAILGWQTDEKIQLVIGNANYETGNVNLPSAYSYQITNGSDVREDSLRGILSTTGPLAAADYDQDGDVDLFVGGRFVPGQYPQSASSRVFKNENGKFIFDQQNSLLFQEKGLVTGATFSDYDADGDSDLLLSTEWGPLKLFKNNEGRFQEVTEEMGLEKYNGWWNGITTGDFNKDGLPDIVATNQGQNSPYQLKNNQPLRMYYQDFSGNRRMDIIEAYANKNGNYVPGKRLFNYNSLPVFARMGMSYQQFGHSTLQDILGDNLSSVPYKEINTFEHMLFINTGDGFEAHPLPLEAQFSTGFDAVVGDYNNDGNEDLFLTQNFFGVHREVPRQDAGQGKWLQGDGKGNLSDVPAKQSGIKIYGEQRGAALADFNNDGKVDLAVSQNEEATKLYLNQTEKAGIRVQLEGPPGNKNGIGSTLRLVYADGTKGPLREVKAGSGYWSQNSPVQVLGYANELKSIEIVWSDGQHQTVDATKEQTNYTIGYPEQ